MKNNSFTISLFVFIIYMLASCRTEYVPVESIRYDSIFIAKLQKDSIFIHDSIYTKEKGDTVFQWKYKYIYKYIVKEDTAFIERNDTVCIPIPVETKLTWWQKQKMEFGGWLLGIAISYIVYRLIGWLIRRTRKE